MQRIAQRPDAVLLLADGTVFRGKALGKPGTTGGELCFNTGMTGYQEIYTDPSYFGQIVIHTMPHIGNYGVKKEEVESGHIQIAGMVCNAFSDFYSRNDADHNLDAYLVENEVTGIAGIDTRMLVRHIRHQGAMNAILSSENTDIDFLKAELARVPEMESLELASKVMRKQAFRTGTEGGKRLAILDFGIKESMIGHLGSLGLDCLILPGNASFDAIREFGADGLFISNGPGDPASMPEAVQVIRTWIDTGKPVFGICLGHQLIARSFGLSTYKMKNGHRGLNHPVKNLLTGHCEITSQNHGFAVNKQELEAHPDLVLSHLNLNDNTVEGLHFRNGKGFSVQYHPESSPGPHDSRYLFEDFHRLLS